MRKLLALALSATAFVATATPALADPITIDFTGTDFTNIFVGGTPATGPYSTVQGNFTYDFDTTTGIFTLLGLSTDVGTTHYDLTNAGAVYTNGALTLGGNIGGVPGWGFPNDFVLNLLVNRTSGQIDSGIQLQYTTPDFHIYQAGNLTVAPAVPEPATWAMMLLGFLGMGVAIRRSRSSALPQLA
jgi:hypothetical protein